MTTTKARLHQLIDELPESGLADAEHCLEGLRTSGDAGLCQDPFEAPFDDEPETEEERAAVDQAWKDVRAGRVVSNEDLRRELGWWAGVLSGRSRPPKKCDASIPTSSAGSVARLPATPRQGAAM
ncbi:MAG: hypothetical protein ACR2PL_26730 [Dehalococcoidia bacterium]